MLFLEEIRSIILRIISFVYIIYDMIRRSSVYLYDIVRRINMCIGSYSIFSVCDDFHQTHVPRVVVVFLFFFQSSVKVDVLSFALSKFLPGR